MTKRTIGEFLAARRKQAGLTQREVAERLGVSNKTLSGWESGRSYPDILILPALARLYGVTVDEILRGECDDRSRESVEDIVGSAERAEEAQADLFKIAANRYSVRCTTLTGIGIGGVGLMVLALCLGFAAAWLLVLFAVLSVLTEAAVVILFAVFEKSALLAEETPSRYSLEIKQMTYRAVFKIVCALCVPLACGMVCMQIALRGGVTASVLPLLAALAVFALSAVLLVWLSRRGKEFRTEEECATHVRNGRLARKIFSIGGTISIAILAAGFALSLVTFSHLERTAELPKEDFLRLMQTIEVSAEDAADYGIRAEGDGETCSYFVDVERALSDPVETSFAEKQGPFYRIEGNLYFSFYLINDANAGCSVSYIPDLSEPLWIAFCRGSVWFRDGAFLREHPALTPQDLLAGIQNEEVFFVLNEEYSANASATDGFGGYRYPAERHVEVSDETYALVQTIEQTYPFLAPLGVLCALIAAAVCLFAYAKKRTAA